MASAGTSPQTRHPVTATLAALATLDPWLRAQDRPAADAITLARLAGEVDALPGLLSRLSGRWGSDERAVLATLLLHDVAWRVAGPACAAYLATGRVLRLDAETVALRFDAQGASTAVTFTERRCWSSPDDPVSGHADVTAAAPSMLVTLLRDQLRDALDPFVSALRPWARRSARVRWALVSDAVVAAARWAGQELDDDAGGLQLGTDLLDGEACLPGAAGWTAVTAHGRTEMFRTRTACCLAYRLAEPAYCDTVPAATGCGTGAAMEDVHGAGR